MELFFDLVYVFAFTQVSELLYEHLTFEGALETAVVFLALWWAWNHTAWTTNWIDPERITVVGLLSVLMVISLVLSATILRAFEQRGAVFAVAYVSLQLLRIGFMVWVFGWRARIGRNQVVMFVWAAVAGVAWIAGGIVDDSHARLAIWGGAIVIEYAMPLLGFRLPGADAVPVEAWPLAGVHLTERLQLVLLVAFGETMLRIGEAFTAHPESLAVDAAFATGFVLIFALWAIYFLHHAQPSVDPLGRSDPEALRLGGSVFTYAHAVMVGAVLAVAVAIHMTVEEPNATVTPGFAVICLGGPALYLLGIAMSMRWLGHGRNWPPIVGAVALVVIGTPAVLGSRLSDLIAAAAVSAALAVVAAVDYVREPDAS